MAYGNDGRVMNSVYPLMPSVTVSAGIYGMVEGCAIVHIDYARTDHADIMYGVVLPHTHHGPRYLVAPYEDAHFPPNIPHMLENPSVTTILNTVDGHEVPQYSGQARSLPDADICIVAERDEMSSIEHNTVIG